MIVYKTLEYGISGVPVASDAGVVDADLGVSSNPLCAVQVHVEGEVKDL